MKENIKITVHFNGCNCGCTESEQESFYGDNKEVLKNAIRYYMNHTVRKDNPFDKVSIAICESNYINDEDARNIEKCTEQEIEVITKIVEIKAIAVYKINGKISSIQLQLYPLQSNIKYYEEAAKLLKIEIPEHIKNEIVDLNIQIKEKEDQIEKLKLEIDEIYNSI